MDEKTLEEKVECTLKGIRRDFNRMLTIATLVIGSFCALSFAANSRSIKNEVRIQSQEDMDQTLLALYRSTKFSFDYLKAFNANDSVKMAKIRHKIDIIEQELDKSTEVIFRGN